MTSSVTGFKRSLESTSFGGGSKCKSVAAQLLFSRVVHLYAQCAEKLS
jgi:hypothetical protein